MSNLSTWLDYTVDELSLLQEYEDMRSRGGIDAFPGFVEGGLQSRAKSFASLVRKGILEKRIGDGGLRDSYYLTGKGMLRIKGLIIMSKLTAYN